MSTAEGSGGECVHVHTGSHTGTYEHTTSTQQSVDTATSCSHPQSSATDSLKAQTTTSRNKLQLSEVKGDLFSCPASASLVHCVSEDMHMGKGIATLFKQKFGGVGELKSQGQPFCLIILAIASCLFSLEMVGWSLRIRIVY